MHKLQKEITKAAHVEMLKAELKRHVFEHRLKEKRLAAALSSPENLFHATSRAYKKNICQISLTAFMT